MSVFQVPYIFPYSNINHSRTTDFCDENGTVENQLTFIFAMSLNLVSFRIHCTHTHRAYTSVLLLSLKHILIFKERVLLFMGVRKEAKE